MSKHRPLPPLERLQALLNYHPEIGWLVWKVNRSNLKAGSRAGSVMGAGYRQVRVDGKDYLEHRLVWLLYYGEDPGNLHIDHINGRRADNCIANLRLCTHAENVHNQTRLQPNNTSGIAGVCWNKQKRKWQVAIRLGGRSKRLGYFDSLKEAAAVRRAAELDHFGEFAPQRVAQAT